MGPVDRAVGRFLWCPRAAVAPVVGRRARADGADGGLNCDAVTGKPRALKGYRNDVPTEDRLLMTLQKRGEKWYVIAATAKGEVQC